MDFVTDVTGKCEKHGEYQAKRWVMPGGSVMVSPCPICREGRSQQDRILQDEARVFQFRLSMASAGIGSRYYESSFDNYRVTVEGERIALSSVQAYAEGFNRRTSRNLVMYGKTGTGKTHLACAMTRLLLMRGVSVLYLPILTLFSQYQDITSYGGSGLREEFFSRMRAPDLLIVDEFGIVTMRDSERIVLHRVIDERYNRNAPVVFIGNVDFEVFQRDVGERAFRRVFDDAETVVFAWERMPINRDLFVQEA